MKTKKWSSNLAIQGLKELYKNGRFYYASYVKRNFLKKYNAACRYFGSFIKGMEAAGLNYKELKLKQKKKEVVKEIQKRYLSGKPINANSVPTRLRQKGCYYFQTWDNALTAANFDPRQIRLRFKYQKRSKKLIIKEIQTRHSNGEPLDITHIEKHCKAL